MVPGHTAAAGEWHLRSVVSICYKQMSILCTCRAYEYVIDMCAIQRCAIVRVVGADYLLACARVRTRYSSRAAACQ